MPQIKAVQTPIGVLYGRDAIYLDHVHMNYSKKELILKGEINGGWQRKQQMILCLMN